MADQAMVQAFENEIATTLKVLRAFPPERGELRPHAKCRTARELAWTFAVEQMLGAAALQDRLDLSGGLPPAPATYAEAVAAFEKGGRDLLAALRASNLDGSVRFFTGPKQMGDVPKPQFMWFLLHDQIHHRGQFSIYLRMADAKVPSIYGPSADEPWM
ncbi:MAG: DinB family protein [Gemmatimonadetes bacterium]|nr:DinB family protein [Gemmatimonadota bacterium]